MIETLRAAGFSGIEAEGSVIHARLWSSSVEFTATPEQGVWRLALCWPLRASDAQRAAWTDEHPDVPMDLFGGETRVSMVLHDGDLAALRHWAAVAEQAVATCIRWRRAQRAPGEGM